MHGFESLDELEETIPEFDNVSSTTWWRLISKVFFQRSFVGKLNEDVIVISMRITAMELYDALRMLGIREVFDFLSVLNFRGIAFERKSIWVRVVNLLS